MRVEFESDLEKVYAVQGKTELSDEQIKELWALDGKRKDRGKHPSKHANDKRDEASKDTD